MTSSCRIPLFQETVNTLCWLTTCPKNAKVARVSLIGLVGLTVLLVGLFTHAYGFFVGPIMAVACWVGSGILAKYWEITK
jgi:hypothetical protein